jgi:hypothetical protein
VRVGQLQGADKAQFIAGIEGIVGVGRAEYLSRVGKRADDGRLTDRPHIRRSDHSDGADRDQPGNDQSFGTDLDEYARKDLFHVVLLSCRPGRRAQPEFQRAV